MLKKIVLTTNIMKATQQKRKTLFTYIKLKFSDSSSFSISVTLKQNVRHTYRNRDKLK